MRLIKRSGLLVALVVMAGIAVPATAFSAAPASSGPAEVSVKDEGARLVVLGDSQAAGTILPRYADERGCEQSVSSWPKTLAASIGVLDTTDFVDATCPGSAIDSGDGWALVDQVKWAQEKAALGPATEAVLLQFGLNDTWGNGVEGYLGMQANCFVNVIDGCDRNAVAQNRAPSAAATTAESYAGRVAQVVDYIKYYAPNARIALVGYPEMTPQRGDEICGTVLGQPITQPRGGAIVDWFGALDNATRGAAQILDIEFVDSRGVFSGHGPCTPEPWVSGIFDLPIRSVGPLHNNWIGDAVLAELVQTTLELQP